MFPYLIVGVRLSSTGSCSKWLEGPPKQVGIFVLHAERSIYLDCVPSPIEQGSNSRFVASRGKRKRHHHWRNRTGNLVTNGLRTHLVLVPSSFWVFLELTRLIKWLLMPSRQLPTNSQLSPRWWRTHWWLYERELLLISELYFSLSLTTGCGTTFLFSGSLCRACSSSVTEGSYM